MRVFHVLFLLRFFLNYEACGKIMVKTLTIYVHRTFFIRPRRSAHLISGYFKIFNYVFLSWHSHSMITMLSGYLSNSQMNDWTKSAKLCYQRVKFFSVRKSGHGISAAFMQESEEK